MKPFVCLSALALALLPTGCADGYADTADSPVPAPSPSSTEQSAPDAAAHSDATVDETSASHPDAAPEIDGPNASDSGVDAATDSPITPQPGCTGTMADCYPDSKNLCETDLATSVVHCGKCNSPCPAYSKCVYGSCVLECEKDQANCNGDLADGCEIDLTASVLHCGGCGKACTDVPFSYKATCSAAACHTTCETGHSDCDGVYDNGCETDSANDVSSCGKCGEVCSIAHATAACKAGSCKIGSCDPGWADCNDYAWGDGCEVDILHDLTNCGACGNSCSFPHAAAACADGKCVMGACETGWGDCNGNPADGCETSLVGNPENCSFCGHDCGDGSCPGEVCLASPVAQKLDIKDLSVSGQYIDFVTSCGAASTNCETGDICLHEWLIDCGSTGFAADSDSSSMFWLESGGRLRRITFPFTNIVDLATGLVAPTDLAVDSKYVYVLANGKLGRVSKSGGSLALIASNMASAQQIEVDSDAIYSVAGSTISRISKLGLTPQSLVTATAPVRSIQSAGGHLYWLADDELWRIPAAGGTPEHLLSAPELGAFYIVDNSTVYFGTGNAVARSDWQGLRPIATGLGNVTRLVVANGQVWWVAGNKAYRTPS